MQDPAPLEHDMSSRAAGFPGVNGILAGRFHIEARLGAGGMGEVYRARDATLRRLVALKHTQRTATEADRRRFLHEGQRASALNHPGIAAVYDTFTEAGEAWLVMEYIEGETLRSRLARPIARDEFRRIAIESAAALAAAHDKGILHRDIKPENIMLAAAGTHPGQVKLLDFGLAQQAADESLETATALTMAGMFAGTPQYMAPEILNGEPADRRSDIFALGVVFYEMLSGRHPFAAPTPTAMIGQVLHQPPRPLDPAVPAAYAAIVTRALAKSPAERYQTAHEIVYDLNHTDQVRSQPGAAIPTPAAPVVTSPHSRKPAIAFAAVTAAIVIASLTYFVRHRHPGPNQAATIAAAPVIAGTLAVLPPTVADASDSKLITYGRGLADSLAQRLSALTVNHDVAVLTEKQLQDRKVATLTDAAKELGATSGLAIKLTRDGDLVHAAYTVAQPDKSASQTNAPARTLASGTVTAPVSDMFAIENQLAVATATALNIPLRTDEQRALADHGTTFPEAYQYFLQGRGYLLEAFTPAIFKSAQTMFNEALRIDPNYGAAKAGLGESWLVAYEITHQAADIEQARKACQDAVTLGNAGADGHICLGTLAEKTGKAAEAVTEYQKALQLEPANDRASIGLAKSYEKLNQPDKAQAVYKQAIALRPNYWRGYDQLGGFYFRTGDYPRAEEMFRAATEKDPQSFRSYGNLAAALSAQSKDQEATEALKKSIALHPTAIAYSNLGTSLFKLHRFDEAAENFRLSIQLAPGAHDIWSYLGDAEYYGGHRTEAMSEYRKGIELATSELKASPNDASVLGDIAGMYSMLGNAPEAIDFMNRALAINHTDSQLMFNAALLYSQLHQTGPALEWLSKALAAGYPPSVVDTAPALDYLHSNPRYRQLLQSTKH